MTKTLFALLISLCLTVVAHGQVSTMDEHKLDAFAHAIAKAEGFGLRNTLPTRFHNPGDIKRKGHYIRFKSDAEGWSALRKQIARLASGESKHYRLDMTIDQVSKTYAGDHRWGRIVARELGVSPSATLDEYFSDTQVSGDQVREFCI